MTQGVNVIPEVEDPADLGGDDVTLQGHDEGVGRHPCQDDHWDQHHRQHLHHLLPLAGVSDRVT